MINKWYVAIWSEGKYIDFWSFNHFFSGFLLAGFLIFIKAPHWLNFLLLLVLMVLWEIYEYKIKVRETLGNKIIDLLVGSIGFLSMYLLSYLNIFDFVIMCIGAFALYAVLEIWGYWAYKMRKK